jgi:hypothetical protein
MGDIGRGPGGRTAPGGDRSRETVRPP